MRRYEIETKGTVVAGYETSEGSLIIFSRIEERRGFMSSMSLEMLILVSLIFIVTPVSHVFLC